MVHDINLGGTIYISSRRAAEISGYKQDYIGQLARSGAIEAKRVSGLWYVLEESLMRHKEKAESYVPSVVKPKERDDKDVSVSFDGKDYISASRASKITSYSSDYITQLARAGTVLGRQVGSRWFVDRESLLAHKSKKDALLASVQRDSVGLENKKSSDFFETQEESISKQTHFTYLRDDNKDFLPLKNAVEDTQLKGEGQNENITNIPIRIVPSQEKIPGEKTGKPVFFVLMSVVGIGIFASVLFFNFSRVGYPKMPVLEGKGASLIKMMQSLLSKELYFSRANDF